MEGFNWWGIFSFCMPIAIGICIGFLSVIAMAIDGATKLIKIIKR